MRTQGLGGTGLCSEPDPEEAASPRLGPGQSAPRWVAPGGQGEGSDLQQPTPQMTHPLPCPLQAPQRTSDAERPPLLGLTQPLTFSSRSLLLESLRLRRHLQRP